MKEEKKVVKKSTKASPKADAKVESKMETKPVAKKTAKAKSEKPSRVVKAEKIQPVSEKVEVKPSNVVEKKVEKEPVKKITLHQDLNLVIGLCALISIITFCFAFQGGSEQILGWELVLKSANYSGVFQGIMILFVISLFIDCILAIHVDTENNIFNIVEKVLYVFTIVVNFIVV
ncbi:MAG: hypothetical protein ACLRFE_01685, partial [Clostridia bacterium]